MNPREFITWDSCRPFRARAGGGSYPGFRPTSLGYIPAAASRLRVFVILSDQVPDIEKRIRIVK